MRPEVGRTIVNNRRKMTEQVNLVVDLALILISAGVVTILSKALKQPLILGYLIAGFLVGPHLGFFPSVVNTDTVKQWSDIGIIFLLFALGLEFSFKKLLKVGGGAIITAGTICIGMMVVGLTVGSALGWSTMECVFLGGLMSMSSTTIIIKSYDEMGYKNKPYAPFVFGVLVVEDMIAVLLMVLLSTLAVSQKFAGGEMLFNLAKLAFFIILWFLAGIFIIPSLLRRAEKYLNDEILLIVSLGLCFTMVVLAEEVGFSSALGAFLMGSILSETLQAEKIQKLVLPIKNLFGAIFFVSVGMMVDPVVIGQHWGTILVLTVTAVVGIIIFCTTGSLLSRQGLDNSVHISFSMAQLGEFSFIIAGLGCSLGVMRDFIYPVIISVSVITTFTTPYMIKAATPATAFLRRKLPEKWLSALSVSEDQKASSAAEESDWKKLFKSYSLRILLYSVVLIAILIGGRAYLVPLAQKLLPSLSDTMRRVICLFAELAVMSPFLYGLGVSSSGISVYARALMRRKSSNKWTILAMILLRALIAVWFVIVAVLSFFRLEGWALFLILFVGISVIIIARRTMNKVSYIEERFLKNLSEKERLENNNSAI